MRTFFQLIDRLSNTQHESTKRELLLNYFISTADPERGYALAILANAIEIPLLTSAQLRKLITDKVDRELFNLSYDYVGDLAETIALLWPKPSASQNILANTGTESTYPLLTSEEFAEASLTELLSNFTALAKIERCAFIQQQLNTANLCERWVLLKLLTGKLSQFVTIKTLKQTLAIMGNTSTHSLEEVWCNQQPPYLELFHWLAGKTAKPTAPHLPAYLPIMQARPIGDEELSQLNLAQLQIEWCWNGIRVQLISKGQYKALLNRQGDDLGVYFPELMAEINIDAVLDGILLSNSGNIEHIQQRSKRNKPNQHFIRKYPVHIQLFDVLSLNNEDFRKQPLTDRRAALEQWHHTHKPKRIYLSEILAISNATQLQLYCQQKQANARGLLFKHLDSIYTDSSTKQWLQWQQDPYLINAVLMYAQRGQGRLANYLAEYTVGLWQDQQLLPIAKPYINLSEAEIMKIDKWVKQHTVNRFGPVRAVLPQLVFEIAFENVHPSNRHVAGYTLQFPRINKVRWDKDANEAGTIAALQEFVVAKQEELN